jgi:hypothetical protein
VKIPKIPYTHAVYFKQVFLASKLNFWLRKEKSDNFNW